MKTVTSTEYYEDLYSFIRKHSAKADYRVYTSGLENNTYHKEWCFEDGATFCEVNEMDVTEIIETEVHGVIVKTPVHFIRHEYWSTEFGSKYWYEAR